MVDKAPLAGIGRWVSLSGYLLFFLMLVFPLVLSLVYVKAFLFGLLLVFVGVRGVRQLYLHLHLKVIVWTLALAVVSLFFCFKGMFLGAPGAVKCTEVYVVWPLVYLVLLSGIDSMGTLKGLGKTMVLSSCFIGLFGILFSLSQLGVIPPIPYLDSLISADELSSGFGSEHVELYFPGLVSMPFLVPFLVAMIVAGPRDPDTKLGLRVWLWLALLVDLIVALLSGRRGLQLVTILAPLLTFVLGSFQPVKQRVLLRKSIGKFALIAGLGIVISVPLLHSVYPITYEGLTERFSTGWDFGASSLDDSPGARREQYFALVDGWIRDPLTGAGLGASAYGSIRSETMPWSYELYYLALLFQTGIVGFAVYTAGIVWIFWSAIKIIRAGGAYSKLLIPVVVGVSGFLIATGTNPYLARFDGIWVVFLPLAFINHWLLTPDQALERSKSGLSALYGHAKNGIA